MTVQLRITDCMISMTFSCINIFIYIHLYFTITHKLLFRNYY